MENNEEKPSLMKIKTPSGDLWLDWDRYTREQNWFKQKEKEYWDYHFSGQRTIDMFGEEGAKLVLARQDREDAKLRFNHRSRGSKNN